MNVNRRFYRKIAAFRGKYAFNVHFFFIQKSAYVKISILEFILLVQKKVSKKHFQIFCCLMNTFLQVCIVCTDRCISKIPRIFRKNIIGYSKAQCSQIFNKEHCCCSRIAFSENMNLFTFLNNWILRKHIFYS